MISRDQLFTLMTEAIREASLSVDEDERTHPKVGAILVDADGTVLARAHRGETPGAHAEFSLLKKLAGRAVDFPTTTLLTTLEPCVHRGEAKVPCAERVASAGVGTVVIGTLDPNPSVTGHGEMYLSYLVEHVERFPTALHEECKDLNSAFFETHRAEHVPRSSLYISASRPTKMAVANARKSSDRNRLLQATLELIAGGSGDVQVIARDVSWFREANVAFLGAVLGGRRVQLCCHSPQANEPAAETFAQAVGAANAIGIEVRESVEPPPIRSTTVWDGGGRSSIVIDAAAAHLLSEPEDSGLISILTSVFDDLWSYSAEAQTPGTPRFHAIEESALAGAIRSIPMYESCDVAYETVDPGRLLPLTRSLERFKLFRLTQLRHLQARYGVPAAATIEGSPWPITPPVVERRGDDLVIIDGTHRVFEAVRAGRPMVEVLVVSDVEEDLPALPTSWDDVRLLGTKLPRLERYDDFQPELFRPLRGAFRSIAGIS